MVLGQSAGASASTAALRMKVSVIPNEIPADGGTYSAVFVQLVSQAGQVVAAPQDYVLSLTSANLSVASVQPALVIHGGQNYGVASLTSTSRPGSTDITLAATGLMPAIVAVKTYGAGGPPYSLASFVAPTTLISDGTSSYYFVVQLLDVGGIPAQAPSTLSLSVTSSNPDVAQLPATLLIPQGAKGASEQFTAGSVAGSTTITTQLNNVFSSSINVTSGLLPLAVDLTASGEAGVATGSSVQFTVTALSAGVPVSGATVSWTASSSSDVFTGMGVSTGQNGTAAATILLKEGGNLTVTAVVNALGYGTKSASVSFPVASRSLSVTVIPDSTQVNASDSTGVTAIVTSAGKPVQGAQVAWTSSLGSVTPQSSTTGGSGAASTIFSSPVDGNATISAHASAAGYTSGSGNAVVTVGAPSGVSTGSAVLFGPLAYIPGPVFFGIPILLVAIVVLVILLVVVVRLRRRRGVEPGAEEATEETEAEGE
ncbi:MAG: Ig-like domain-containing protein [Nitrososphaerota archaeon]|nr:Ig-like domain-containing protein [Nitrososphaerota archaeon]